MILRKIMILIETCRRLHEATRYEWNLGGTPKEGYDGPWGLVEGIERWEETSHWGNAKARIEKLLGRRLTGREITALSLAVNYGPTPLLKEREREILRTFMARDAETCPPKGYNWSWYELGDVFCHIYNALL